MNLHVHNEDGSRTATPIVELKNMNSFKNVELAIDYETRRQWKQWQKTGKSIADAPKQRLAAGTLRRMKPLDKERKKNLQTIATFLPRMLVN